jgi:hypothetical protein
MGVPTGSVCTGGGPLTGGVRCGYVYGLRIAAPQPVWAYLASYNLAVNLAYDDVYTTETRRVKAHAGQAARMLGAGRVNVVL